VGVRRGINSFKKIINISSWIILMKINSKAFLWLWLLSNAEAALQHCSATKATKRSSSLFCSTNFYLGDSGKGGHQATLERIY